MGRRLRDSTDMAHLHCRKHTVFLALLWNLCTFRFRLRHAPHLSFPPGPHLLFPGTGTPGRLFLLLYVRLLDIMRTDTFLACRDSAPVYQCYQLL